MLLEDQDSAIDALERFRDQRRFVSSCLPWASFFNGSARAKLSFSCDSSLLELISRYLGLWLPPDP